MTVADDLLAAAHAALGDLLDPSTIPEGDDQTRPAVPRSLLEIRGVVCAAFARTDTAAVLVNTMTAVQHLDLVIDDLAARSRDDELIEAAAARCPIFHIPDCLPEEDH